MKNKIFYLTSILIAFSFGMVVMYISMTKQQMDRILNVKTKPISCNILEKKDSNNIISEENEEKLVLKNRPQTVQPNVDDLLTSQQDLTINDYSQEQASQLVDNMPNVILEQYIDKFMAHGTSELLIDKRRFAQRAIEEIYTQNDSQPLSGEVKLSYSNTMPDISIDTSSINSRAKIYAHLDTRGQVSQSPYVFVKWVNNTTGQVLLFTKKDIVADSNQNWVSFIPENSWQVGNYDIRFYQFTSELEPIAQISYQINEVTDTINSTIISKTTVAVLKKQPK